MGSTPQTDNKTADAVNTGIKVLENAGVAAVESLIIADYPFLGFIGIKQIWEGLFEWIAGYFCKVAETGATFAVIDIQVDLEKSKLSTALKNLIAAEKSGDQNAIKAAVKAYADANSSLLHDDGSATPQ